MSDAIEVLPSGEHEAGSQNAKRSPPGMVWIPGGTFRMGSDDHYPEEAPVHRVKVDGFWIDRTPVTNSQFREFVDATGYVTFAQLPGITAIISMVFQTGPFG